MCKKLLHAGLVSLNGKGILLLGASRSGKSDTILRLIEEKNALLVADDVVEVSTENSCLIGKAPANLYGLLEISGVGIVKYEALADSGINLVVRLKQNAEEISRLPNVAYENILGLEIPAIDLYAKEASSVHKIVAALQNKRIEETDIFLDKE